MSMARPLSIVALAFASMLSAASTADKPAAPPPLRETRFVALPLGAVKPAGWLRDQLVILAQGLTGRLDEFWPSLSESAWKGGSGDAWERGPYYLDGLVPLAYLLDDQRLIAKVKPYIETTLASARPDGWFGPAKNKDRWALAVAMKALMQYQEASGDARVVPFLANYFAYLASTPPDWPDSEWRGVRARENVVVAYWLYNRTHDARILEAVDAIFGASFDWNGFFHRFPYTTEALKKGFKFTHQTHGVNLAMAIKYGGLQFLRSNDPAHRDSVYAAINSLDTYHGQANGTFSADEHLAGTRPTQGTELCLVVEYMFSLEKLIEALGDPAFGDRLELIAYNANPGATTADYWAHQYDQQTNQVLCSVAKRAWSMNDDTSNIYGLEPNYGCCTANMHQGWPKLVAHLWMATRDGGLAAVAYGPCRVTAKVAAGVTATVVEDTEYPFDGTVRCRVELAQDAAFPITFRIPAWAKGATLRVGAESFPAEAGTFAAVKRTWRNGDMAVLTLPMELRVEFRERNAATIHRGPLLFALRVGEEFRKLKSYRADLAAADYEVHPTTPWNYAIVLDRANVAASFGVATRPVGKIPFASDAPPVVLKARGVLLPDWKLVANSAGETPQSPVKVEGPLVGVELVPYGCARLRVTEIPWTEPRR